jgi:hypothetical protein
VSRLVRTSIAPTPERLSVDADRLFKRFQVALSAGASREALDVLKADIQAWRARAQPVLKLIEDERKGTSEAS